MLKIFPGIFNNISYDTLSVHVGKVVKIRSSPDGRYVFSVGNDGNLFIYQVSELSAEGMLITSNIAA